MTALWLLKCLFQLSNPDVSISPLFLYNNMFLSCSEKTMNCTIATLKTANLVLEKNCFKEYIVELIHSCENIKRSVI